MRRLIILMAVAAGMFLAMRLLAKNQGPVMRKRCLEMCDRMLDNMPDSFPPNRMMADLDSIKEQTARTLSLLEGQEEE